MHLHVSHVSIFYDNRKNVPVVVRGCSGGGLVAMVMAAVAAAREVVLYAARIYHI